MNCKHVQDLIMTDYGDGQLPSAKAKSVENHLMQCLECRMFAQKVQRETAAPFAGGKVGGPDDFVWQRIKAKLPQPSTVDIRRPVFTRPSFLARPLVFATGLILMLVTAAVVQQTTAQRQPYLSYIMGTDTPGEDDAGIEAYFL